VIAITGEALFDLAIDPLARYGFYAYGDEA
jgi:hypothetical protein